MMRIIVGIFRRLAYLFSVPVTLALFFDPATGKEYSVGLVTKLRLFMKMRRNYQRITTASYVIEHLVMATQILRVPKSTSGVVIECGSFKGGSATNLSLVCELCNRQLKIFDSFAGLPEPVNDDGRHMLVGLKQVHTYEKGAWAGALEEVKGNISKYGAIGVCEFKVGYFEQTLVTLHEPCVFAFVDVDLRGSLETCLFNIWPRLQDNCYFFTHEAPHFEISSLFFSEVWWNSKLRCAAPGLVGAGSGLGLLPDRNGFRSDLGYTVKYSAASGFRLNPQTGMERMTDADLAAEVPGASSRGCRSNTAAGGRRSIAVQPVQPGR